MLGPPKRRRFDELAAASLEVAAGQNLKRLVAATGWGRRHAPCGSRVALPREPSRLLVASG
jgi:hypothetical protein